MSKYLFLDVDGVLNSDFILKYLKTIECLKYIKKIQVCQDK